MPVKIELQAHGAGRAVLQVSGTVDTPESVALAIQRNDGLYLGPDQVWQSSPHWHPQFGVQPRPGGLAMELTAEIVDGVIDAGGVPLKVSLRLDDREEFGVLRIRGELIGSGAAASPNSRPQGLNIPADIPLEPETTFPDLIVEPGQDAPPPPPLIAELPEHRVRHVAKKTPWLLVFLLLFVLAGATGAWYLGLLDPIFNKFDKPAVTGEPPVPELPLTQTAPTADDQAFPDKQTPEPTPDEPEPGEPGEEQAPAAGKQTTNPAPPPLTGVAFAREFLADHPAPNAIFTQAGKAEQAGDCDAALVLFNTAANQDPAQATRLAARYDPQGFQAGPCIDQPDAPYAIIFYSDAAATGAIDAQRRLGQLLTARESSGPTFEEGMEWLRKAAAAGDPKARASLDQLEQRP